MGKQHLHGSAGLAFDLRLVKEQRVIISEVALRETSCIARTKTAPAQKFEVGARAAGIRGVAVFLLAPAVIVVRRFDKSVVLLPAKRQGCSWCGVTFLILLAGFSVIHPCSMQNRKNVRRRWCWLWRVVGAPVQEWIQDLMSEHRAETGAKWQALGSRTKSTDDST